MDSSGFNYDPLQMTMKLRDILSRGNSSELQNYMESILAQYGAPPLARAIIAPLVQSLVVPFSQYFNSFTDRPIYAGPIESESEEQNEPQKPVAINSMLFEIHGFVIIRANIPDGIDEKTIKVFFSPGYITIKGDPSGEDHIVQLPPGTMQEGATATIKNRILEIKIPKESSTKPDNEIGIDYI